MARRLLPGLLVALLLDPAHAAAHAIIVESAPAVGATVAGPDVDVTLRFNRTPSKKRTYDFGRSVECFAKSPALVV